MAGEIRLSTAGIRFLYAVETEAGKRPTSGYKDIEEVTEIPETSASPETIDATPLSSTRFRIYVSGLIDLGGALSYTANFSQPLLTAWNKTLVPLYESSIAEGKNMWFCTYIPGFDDSLYYTGVPTRIGGPGATVGEVLRITLPITPSNEPDWYEAPTDIDTLSISADGLRVVAAAKTAKKTEDEVSV